MCNTSAIYFQIFKPFGYKELKNSEYYGTINIYNCSFLYFLKTRKLLITINLLGKYNKNC